MSGEDPFPREYQETAGVSLSREGEGRGEGDQMSRPPIRTGKSLINFIALTLTLSLSGEGIAAAAEFQVNSYTPGDQSYPAACADDAGHLTVVWESRGRDGSGTAVRAAQHDASGAGAEEIAVNATTANDQQLAAVSCTPSGEFIVAWESRGQDGDDFGIVARRFDGSGPRGGEVAVNSYTTERQRAASLCRDGRGGFVVAWQSYEQDGDGYGIFGQRFDGADARRGEEFRVSSFTEDSQAHPAIACAESGFVAIWQSAEQDGDGYGIFARRWDSAGAPLGSEFQVNTATIGDQQLPAIAVNSGGDFLIVWQSDDQDGDGTGILARRLARDGGPAGPEMLVNTFTAFDQEQPAVAATTLGGFLVVWSSARDGDEHGVFARPVDAAGVPRESEFQVNTYTLGVQGAFSDEGHAIAVAATASGERVIVWHSTRTVGTAQDGDGFGVFAQRSQRSALVCVGDCSGDLAVGIDELVLGVTLALADRSASACPSFDRDGDDRVRVPELVAAVRSALDGCLELAAPPILTFPRKGGRS
jgi:hypothetical protein